MISCPSSEQLQSLLLDRLTGAEAEAVEAHIETCASCQHALEQLTDEQYEHSLAAPVQPEGAAEETGGAFLRRLEQEPADDAGQPRAIRKAFVPGEPTIDERAGGAPPAEPAGRIQVAPRPGLGPSSSGEVQTLLRKRLRIVTLICLAAFAVFLPIEFFSYEHSPELVWFVLVPYAVVMAMTAALAPLLWSPWQLSFLRLRFIELIAFGGAILGFSWNHYHTVRIWLPVYAARGPVDVAILATCATHIWFALIVSYAAFIPNTWRRCAAVVGVIAAIPVAIGAAVGLTDGHIAGGLLGHFLLLTGLLVSIAAALAVFGAHHIQVLRQQAFAARKLGQYWLRQRLGSGGMGDVYLAEHVLLKRPCAIKVIRPERAGDPRNLARFEREVQATATLTHPNTVEVFDYGLADDGTFYYVMEYLPGFTLEELVKQHGPLAPERVVHLLRQVCGALHEAHAVGLIHRDIKPGNIIVGQRGGLGDVAKLLDFGLVQTHGLGGDGQKLTQDGAIAGTPAYLSPEQAAARGNLDARSDLYSLGAVAYFLLTGQPPFVRGTAVQTLAAHLGEPVVAPDQHRTDVPADLQAAVLRCLEKESARRYPDAGALAEALAGCRCADRWTPAQAAAWWRAHSASNDRA